MPSSKNYIRNYKHEDAIRDKDPKERKMRAERNAARRAAIKAGLVHKGDGKDIDHIKPLSQGGSNAPSNRRVVSAHANRSYKRTSTGAIARTTKRK